MPLCRSPLTLRLALFSRSRTAAVEIPRFILHRRRSEFLPLHRGAKKRAQFALQRTGSQEARSVRLSAALHREPRTALNCRGGTTPSRCAATRGTPKHFAQRAKYFTRAERVFHRAAGAISHGSTAAVFHCGAVRLKEPPCSAHSLLQPFGTKKSL